MTTKEQFAKDADIAAFYGVDSTKLSEDAKEGFYANIPRLWAIRFRNECESHGVTLTPEMEFEVTLMETDDREKAEVAFAEATKKMLLMGETPP